MAGDPSRDGRGAVRTQGSQFHGHHQALRARMPYNRAMLATAHKLLRTIVAMLRDNQPYIDPGIDYDKLLVDPNAARCLREVEEHGYLWRLHSSAQPAEAGGTITCHLRRWLRVGADTDRG